MGVSDKLAALNASRFKSFVKTGDAEESKSECHRRACFAFTGPAFLGLDAGTMTADDLKWAQTRLHILCGLYVRVARARRGAARHSRGDRYGVLRPLDRIQAYRLEMSTKLAVKDQRNLCASAAPARRILSLSTFLL